MNILPQNGTFVKIGEPKLTCDYPPCILVFTLGFTFGVVHSMGLDKWKVTYFHHYNIIRCIFTALKAFYDLPIHPSPSLVLPHSLTPHLHPFPALGHSIHHSAFCPGAGCSRCYQKALRNPLASSSSQPELSPYLFPASPRQKGDRDNE